jgi:hypothetical protein
LEKLEDEVDSRAGNIVPTGGPNVPIRLPLRQQSFAIGLKDVPLTLVKVMAVWCGSPLRRAQTVCSLFRIFFLSAGDRSPQLPPTPDPIVSAQ